MKSLHLASSDMGLTGDLFGKTRAKPRIIMHAADVGIGTYHWLVTFKCAKCGQESELMACDTRTDVKRGMPCPKCNLARIPP